MHPLGGGREPALNTQNYLLTLFYKIILHLLHLQGRIVSVLQHWDVGSVTVADAWWGTDGGSRSVAFSKTILGS